MTAPDLRRAAIIDAAVDEAFTLIDDIAEFVGLDEAEKTVAYEALPVDETRLTVAAVAVALDLFGYRLTLGADKR